MSPTLQVVPMPSRREQQSVVGGVVLRHVAGEDQVVHVRQANQDGVGRDRLALERDRRLGGEGAVAGREIDQPDIQWVAGVNRRLGQRAADAGPAPVAAVVARLDHVDDRRIGIGTAAVLDHQAVVADIERAGPSVRRSADRQRGDVAAEVDVIRSLRIADRAGSGG